MQLKHVLMVLAMGISTQCALAQGATAKAEQEKKAEQPATASLKLSVVKFSGGG